MKSLGSILRNIKKMKNLSLKNEVQDGIEHQLIFELTCENGKLKSLYAAIRPYLLLRPPKDTANDLNIK